jgi:hypothetical protein
MSHRSHSGVSADKDWQSPEISPSAEAQAVVGEISILRYYWVGGRTGCRLEAPQSQSQVAVAVAAAAFFTSQIETIGSQPWYRAGICGRKVSLSRCSVWGGFQEV